MSALMELVRGDGRYTTHKELCGYDLPMYVARFCMGYIGTYETEEEALQACVSAYVDRMQQYIIV